MVSARPGAFGDGIDHSKNGAEIAPAPSLVLSALVCLIVLFQAIQDLDAAFDMINHHTDFVPLVALRVFLRIC